MTINLTGSKRNRRGTGSKMTHKMILFLGIVGGLAFFGTTVSVMAQDQTSLCPSMKDNIEVAKAALADSTPSQADSNLLGALINQYNDQCGDVTGQEAP
jgi:hypothetical protein